MGIPWGSTLRQMNNTIWKSLSCPAVIYVHGGFSIPISSYWRVQTITLRIQMRPNYLEKLFSFVSPERKNYMMSMKMAYNLLIVPALYPKKDFSWPTYHAMIWQSSSGIPMTFFGVAQLIPGWSWRVAKSLRKSGQVEVQGVDRAVLGRSCGAKKCGHPATFFWVTPKKLRQKWIDHD